MTPTNRAEIYHIIDAERDYQDLRWVPTESENAHTPTEFILFMQDYLDEARRCVSRESITTGNPKALAIIRKVVAMGVACMEQNGAVPR